jgi:type I restriction enzyme S subunit
MKGVAVHQLLTGQARLPGFGGEWEMKRLGDVARFFKGKGLPKSALVLGGAQPCIHYGELFTQYGERIMRTLSQTDWVDGCVFSEEGDVLMPTSDVTPRGLAKASCILSGGVVVGGDILIIRLDKSIDGTFLKEGLNNSPKSAIIHPSPNL